MVITSLLKAIQETNARVSPSSSTVRSDVQLYDIDLDSRTIKAPNFLSVQTEHRAETVYFLVDRYHDGIDLATTNCVIQYQKDGKDYIYMVPFCDVSTRYDPNHPKMIIPWVISYSATQTSGRISFVVRFYTMDSSQTITSDSKRLSYSLTTQIATSQILVGMSLVDAVLGNEPYQLANKEGGALLDLIDSISKAIEGKIKGLYWINADDNEST